MGNLNLSLSLITLMLLTLHCTAFYLFLHHHCYLQNIFYNKTFPNWTFEKCSNSSIFFNFWNPSQMVFTRPKQWKHEFAKYVKYAWKRRYKIWSTVKAQERREWCCSGVFIINFRDVAIEDLVEHLRWNFFCNSMDRS